MAKSIIIKDLATNNISVEEALRRLLVITSGLQNGSLNTWILNELNGYSDKSELPPYRKNVTTIVVYSGINGQMQVTNQPLPFTYIPEEFHDITGTQVCMESISSVERIVTGNDSVGKDLTALAGAIYNKTGLQCVSITQKCNIASFIDIVSNVKTKLQIIFLELENIFGLLDSLDIDIDSKTTEEINIVNKKIGAYILSD